MVAELLKMALHRGPAVCRSSLLPADELSAAVLQSGNICLQANFRMDRLVVSCSTSDTNAGLIARKCGSILVSAITGWGCRVGGSV